MACDDSDGLNDSDKARLSICIVAGRSATGCTESDTRRCKRGAPDSLSESHMAQQCNTQTIHLRVETDRPVRNAFSNKPVDQIFVTHEQHVQNDGKHSTDKNFIPVKKPDVSEIKEPAIRQEEDPSSIPSILEFVVKIATMNIDLEAPAAFEPETDNTHEDIIKGAVEAIISISSFEEPQASDTLLMWLAEVIESGESVDKNSLNVNRKDSIPQGMDYFEYMTLNLQEVEEENICYTPMILEEKEEEE
ncbi:tetratricopeptide-like helical domain-containing protein, partial [Tanacetum coccineum]